MKNLIIKIKEEIKSQAAEQRLCKNQRKTVNLVGERVMNPYDAAEKIRRNREELPVKYIAYYILKHGLETPDIRQEKVPHSSWMIKYDCPNEQAVCESIVKCCGENSRFLDDKKDTCVRIWKVIENWKKKYQDKDENA